MGRLLMFKKNNEVEDMPSIFDVAEAFLWHESMSHKKLQKLCYYAQAWHCALYYGKPMFTDDDFEAWVHGPVSPRLYNKYRDYGWIHIESPKEYPENIDEDNKALISEIFRIYGGLTGDQLEALTHSEDPWKEKRAGLKEWQPSTRIISTDSMRDYYLAEYQRSQND